MSYDDFVPILVFLALAFNGVEDICTKVLQAWRGAFSCACLRDERQP